MDDRLGLREHATPVFLGGLLAVAVGVTSVFAPMARGHAMPDPSQFVAALFGVAAGMVVLVRPKQIEFLIGADVLLALAVLLVLFKVMGMLYLPALLLTGFATLSAPITSAPARRERVRPLTRAWFQKLDQLRRAG